MGAILQKWSELYCRYAEGVERLVKKVDAWHILPILSPSDCMIHPSTVGGADR